MIKSSFFSLILLALAINIINAQDSTATLKLLFAGDVMGHGPQIKSAEIVKNNSYDYEPCFKYLSPIIESADLAIANLEVTLPGKAPYQGYPRFRSPDDLARALRLSGFDMMVTSNNHSNDAGKDGVIETINTLKEYGFYQTGTFKNQEEKDWFYPLIVYKDNFKLAFLNYTYDTNGLPTKAPTIVNLIDETQIEKDMAMARALKPDAIIVIMHWGLEYQLTESKVQRELTKNIFDWGADLVIGSHPHVIQPIREQDLIENDSTIKKRLVTYSLGNFISNQNKPNTDGGLIFEISLHKNLKTNKLSLGEHHYIPVWRYIHKDKTGKATFYALPVSAFEEEENVLNMTSKNWEAMLNFAKKTRKHLAKSDGVERKVTLEELNRADLRLQDKPVLIKDIERTKIKIEQKQN
ncbi:MAG: poly-gamma-glutamate capsule biosynthesis protein CapA/YwtB (metallophosphatase superfamily) [Saprospiraceae bacterium]|jgi:poly-gamma-glutamate capsule biosynthesis protein CapA/YwtB (metallophosphatase superfamily)